MRVCSKCGEELPLTTKHFRTHKHGRDGFRADCRVCEQMMQYRYKYKRGKKYSESKKKVYQTPKGYYSYWKSRIKSQFNLTPEEIQEKMDILKGCCEICGDSLVDSMSTKSYHIDHDHRTGEVRGLLCHYCNTGIGLMKEDEEIMLRAITYLKEYNGTNSRTV